MTVWYLHIYFSFQYAMWKETPYLLPEIIFDTTELEDGSRLAVVKRKRTQQYDYVYEYCSIDNPGPTNELKYPLLPHPNTSFFLSLDLYIWQGLVAAISFVVATIVCLL